MAYIKLSSTNPNFSFVLQKNPATQEANQKPFQKDATNARTYLWFENPNEVLLLYRGFENNKHQTNFGYLDYSNYSSGSAILLLINLQLRTAYNSKQELDNIPATLAFTVHNHLSRDYTKSFPGKVVQCNTEYEHSLIVIEGDSVYEALNICAIISLLSILHHPDIYIENPQYLKYLKNAVLLTTDYPLLRSMVSFVKNGKFFESIKPILSLTPFTFSLKRSQDVRKDYYEGLIKSNDLDLGERLIDLGCGEGSYFKLHCKHYSNVDAVELADGPYDTAFHMVRKIQQEEVITVHNSDIKDYLLTQETLSDADVLLTEVLEHMPLSVGTTILKNILSKNPKRVTITLPNHSFNLNYGLKPGEYRHDDHYWEPTHEDIIRLLEGYWNFPEYDVDLSFLGDSMKEDPTSCTTFGIHFKRKA